NERVVDDRGHALSRRREIGAESLVGCDSDRGEGGSRFDHLEVDTRGKIELHANVALGLWRVSDESCGYPVNANFEALHVKATVLSCDDTCTKPGRHVLYFDLDVLERQPA